MKVLRQQDKEWKTFSEMKAGECFLFQGKPAMKVYAGDDSGLVLLESGNTIWYKDEGLPHGLTKFPVDSAAKLVFTL